jgi:hypothetical protein
MRTLIEAKMKAEAPDLHRQLSESGSLKTYLTDLSDEATSNMVSLKMQIAKRQGYENADYLKRAGILNSAQQAAREIVLGELQFPQDETSRPSQAATTDSVTPT